jgi:hypothetical protein
VVKPSTKIAVLPEGQLVRKLTVAPDPTWWRVATDLDGVPFEGFVKAEFLAPGVMEPVVPPPAVSKVPVVHLSPKSTIRRSNPHGRAFPLNEDAQPQRSDGSTSSLAKIIDWLDVEKHERYRPGGGATYCNIYAYDYCYLGAGFLPRVWWTNGALQRLANGEKVEPLYEKTVREMNANSLHDWLVDHGPSFGWRRVAGVGDLQNAANAGRLALICAKRKDLNRSGHIVAVVPETTAQKAIRQSGEVRTPLQSQAGSTNFRYGTQRWWTSDKFSAFGFWVLV